MTPPPSSPAPEAPRRVAMLLDELAPAGGIEAALVTLTQALRPLGWQSIVLLGEPAPADNVYARRLRAASVPVHSLPAWLNRLRLNPAAAADGLARLLLVLALPLAGPAALALCLARRQPLPRAWASLAGRVRRYLPAARVADWALARWLAGWLRRQGAHLVHVHGYGCGAVPMGLLPAALRAGLPVVYSEHGMPWPELAGRADLRQAMAACRGLIAISRATADAMRQVAGIAGPIELVSHVVDDVPPAARAEDARRNGVLTFGCVAMLRPTKGHIYWLRSMPAVLAQFPHVRFVLAGDGSERAALEREAAALGLNGRVEFAGQVDSDRIPALLRGWDAFVLPSLNEPLGIAVVEAMAAGLPIVATEAGGVLDLVQAEHTALLVPPADPHSLAEAQLRLAGDAALRRRLGQAARQAYEQGPFTARRVGEATCRVYAAALGATPQP